MFDAVPVGKNPIAEVAKSFLAQVYRLPAQQQTPFLLLLKSALQAGIINFFQPPIPCERALFLKVSNFFKLTPMLPECYQHLTNVTKLLTLYLP